jgi:phosphoribosylaminoimidazole-succinocarboxamide synthase
VAPPAYAGGPIPGARLLKRGKVRDLFSAGDGRLVFVASDRISAFDVVLEPGIPGKGVVLTQISNFWFDRLGDVVAHHVVSTDPAALPPPFAGRAELAGRACLVTALRMLPVECVVRGYLVGSGWKEYDATGQVCGIRLADGLRQAEKLPAPIFTPTTKADAGHDESIPFDEVARRIGGTEAEQLRSISLALYGRAAAYAETRGIIIADTKFEFGVDETGRIVWADEALTPDSSRFWPVDSYAVGANPPSYDKQFVRDWLETSGWNKMPPAPLLPDEVVAGTRARYFEAFERLTGRRTER